MSRRRLLALAVSLSLLPAGLAVPALGQDAELSPPEATPNPVPLEKPAGDGTGVRLTTEAGDILIGLFTESAPVATENFENLVEAGFYDGTGFHRVQRDFVIQGGDPEGTGMGGPGYTIQDEEVVGEYGRGIVAMARTSAPNSQGSQFFIVTDDDARRSLEPVRTYVIIGRVLGDGMETVDAIVDQSPESDLIEDPIRIVSATIEQVELPEEPDPPPPTVAEAAGAALGATMPATLAGLDVQSTIFDSDQILPGSEADPAIIELTALAEANGAEIAGLAIVNAGASDADTSIALLAGSLPGVPASETETALRNLVLGGPLVDAEETVETIAGHEVRRVRVTPDAGWEETIHIIQSGDVLWFVVTDFDTIEEVIDGLPIDQS